MVSALLFGVIGYGLTQLRDYAEQNRRLIMENEKTYLVLCAQRSVAVKSLAASRKFLAEHPRGIPGIPPGLIRDGIQRSQTYLDTSSILECPPD